MINHAMYKSCLFLTGGAVEKQAGTTDLDKLGGLARSMPVTTICFLVAAASISGVPPFNGFFSKELVYHAALERGWIYYAAALLGSLLTAASFLKLGHAAFFGKRSEENRSVKEAPLPMLVPMILLAGLCILFGLANPSPWQGSSQPAVGAAVTGGRTFAGFPASTLLVGSHRRGAPSGRFSTTGTACAGAEAAWGRWTTSTTRLPLAPVYAVAEKGHLDPYFMGRWVIQGGRGRAARRRSRHRLDL